MIRKVPLWLWAAAVVFALGMALWGAWELSAWWNTRGDDEHPPVVISPDQVPRDLPEPEIPVARRPFRRHVEPERLGVSDTLPEVLKRVRRYASEALDIDSLIPPQLPPVWFERDDSGRFMLAVARSDGRIDRREWDDCPSDRTLRGGTRDTTMFAQCDRAIAGLPDFAKDAVTCVAFGGAGYGLGYLSGYDRPIEVGAAAGGGCVLLKLLN